VLIIDESRTCSKAMEHEEARGGWDEPGDGLRVA